jgi:hypothetical protein
MVTGEKFLAMCHITSGIVFSSYMAHYLISFVLLMPFWTESFVVIG